MLQAMKAAAKYAGAMIVSANLQQADIAEKSGRGEFVTQWDLRVQAHLQQALGAACPAASFLGEEGGAKTVPAKGLCFIVDPIDGTKNFINGYRHSSVSIALANNSQVQAGVVYNPYLDELFYAEAGKGAFCNGRPIRVAERSLRESIVLFGTACYDRSLADATFSLLRRLYDNAEDLRNTGSAALDICYVADARCDVFFELQLSPWDYAAAALILQEAGGVMQTLSGEAPSLQQGGSILAASSTAFRDIQAQKLLADCSN